MSTMRVYTREFRESAVGLVLSQGLSIRVAAEDLGMPYHTLHSWVAIARRGTGGLNTQTAIETAARLRKLEAQHHLPRMECSESKLKTGAQARSSTFEWIEVWYQRERSHSSLLSLGYLSPEKVRGDQESWLV